MKICLLETYEH